MEIYDYTAYLGIVIAIISLMGYLLENAWLAVTKGYIDNRNMNLPFLFGYGLLVVGMYALFGTPDEMMFFRIPLKLSPLAGKIAYFLCAAVIVSVCEIILGTAMEKICGIEYWNYTWIPLHITKYTSVPTSIGFALVITIFMDKCFMDILLKTATYPERSSSLLSIVLILIMLNDMLICYNKMRKNHSLNIKWQKNLRNKHKYS
ncbi:MAG: putative ABC transporter permease [Oscillospiraceae bacterium]